MKRKFADTKDQALIAMFKNGDTEAFGELTCRYYHAVSDTAFYLLKDRSAAEDATQDTFVKAIDALRSDRYGEQKNFKAWLQRICSNLIIDTFRKKKRRKTVSLRTTDTEGREQSLDDFVDLSHEEVVIRRETAYDLRRSLLKLKAEQKETIVLRHYGDMTFKEIAQRTSVSINTSLGRMRYGLINLRKMMEVPNPKSQSNAA